LKSGAPRSPALGLAARAIFVLGTGLALASCGDDVDFCSNPGGEGCPREFSVDFHAQTAGTFGALQFDITHLGDSGGFVGRADKVDCVPLVDAIVASNYLGEREVKIGMISLDGIKTPADLMRCGFRTTEDLEPSDFEIEVTDASDLNSMQVDAPVVVVHSIVER
jgi:hypothetical protein